MIVVFVGTLILADLPICRFADFPLIGKLARGEKKWK